MKAWRPKKYSQFDLLPNEVIYQICEEMEIEDLIRFSKSSKRFSQVCGKILNKRRTEGKFEFHDFLYDNAIDFDRDLNGILTAAAIRYPEISGYLVQQEILRFNNKGTSIIPIKSTELGTVSDGEAKILSGYYDDYDDITMEIKDGYITNIWGAFDPNFNITFDNGMAIFNDDNVPIELLGSAPLFNYIFRDKPEIRKNTELENVITFSYNYDHGKYTFLWIDIPLANDVYIEYFRPELNEDRFIYIFTNLQTYQRNKRELTKQEIEKEIGFAMEVNPGDLKLTVPKGTSDQITKRLYEIALFIDHYPISHFFNILR